MHKRTPILTDGKALSCACAGLQAHLSLCANGYKCKTEDLIQVLVAMTSQKLTLEQACAALPQMPDATTIRGYLNAQLSVAQLPALEGEVNAALQAQLPRHLWRKSLDVAIDVHDQPFYGRTAQEQGKWVKGQRKAGTRRAYRIASACVMQQGLRFTLSIVFMPHGVPLRDALERLLGQLRRLGLQIKCLWMDRGFASVEIMQYLDEQRWSAGIGCPIRGTSAGQGTRALCQGRASYVTQHTFEDHRHHNTYSASVAVCRVVRNTARRSQRRRKTDWGDLHHHQHHPDPAAGAPALSPSLRHRDQLPLCQPSACLDYVSQPRLALPTARAGALYVQRLGAPAWGLHPGPAQRWTIPGHRTAPPVTP